MEKSFKGRLLKKFFSNTKLFHHSGLLNINLLKNSDKTRSLSECDREFEIRDFSTSQRGGVLLQTAILLLSVKSTKIQSTSKKRNGNENILLISLSLISHSQTWMQEFLCNLHIIFSRNLFVLKKLVWKMVNYSGTWKMPSDFEVIKSFHSQKWGLGSTCMWTNISCI